MVTTVDARGLACPQPVIQTRKAMDRGDRVVTLVDNDTARANVERMAKKAGWVVAVTAEGDEYRLEMHQAEQNGLTPDASPQPETVAADRGQPVSGPLVLVVSADSMGRGEPELGGILLRGFFHTLGEVEPVPQTIIFFNAGVKLACEESPVLEDLCALEANGVAMLVCGTCLNYYELAGQLAVGQVSNMYDIAETMLGAGKVVNL